jgi:hypothetical protein
MRRSKSIFVPILFLSAHLLVTVSFSSHAFNTSPPARVCAVVATDSAVYAATWGEGILSSANGQGRWRRVDDGNGTDEIYCLWTGRGYALAGTGGRGVVRFLVDSSGWTRDTATVSGSHVFAFARVAERLFASTWQRGLYMSVDWGRSWSSYAHKTGWALAYCMLTVGDTLLAGTARQGVFRSVDGGETWSGYGLEGRAISAMVHVNHTLLASAWGEGIFRRSSGDTAWIRVDSTAVTVQAMARGTHSTVLSAQRNGGMAVSSDGGSSWERFDQPALDVFSLAERKGSLYLGTWGEGVLAVPGWRNRWPHLLSLPGMPLEERSRSHTEPGMLLPGGGEESESASATVAGTGSRILSLRVCPRRTLLVCFQTDRAGTVRLSVYDWLGAVKARQELAVEQGEHKYSLPRVTEQSAGVYLLVLETATDRSAVPFVVSGTAD